MTGFPARTSMGARAALAALAVLLAACASPPEVRYELREVPVPVKVPCAEPLPAEPVWLVDALPAGVNDFDLAKAYRAEREQRRQYERELRASRAGCDKTGGKP